MTNQSDLKIIFPPQVPNYLGLRSFVAAFGRQGLSLRLDSSDFKTTKYRFTILRIPKKIKGMKLDKTHVILPPTLLIDIDKDGVLFIKMTLEEDITMENTTDNRRNIIMKWYIPGGYRKSFGHNRLKKFSNRMKSMLGFKYRRPKFKRWGAYFASEAHNYYNRDLVDTIMNQ